MLEKLTLFMARLFLGAKPSQGLLIDANNENPLNNVLKYKLEKPAEGYLDILYLDETLRVTRGNRGSVVVVQKA